jgi:hypothetical protein
VISCPAPDKSSGDASPTGCRAKGGGNRSAERGIPDRMPSVIGQLRNISYYFSYVLPA